MAAVLARSRTIELRHGAIRLAIEPERGGRVTAFERDGRAIFRTAEVGRDPLGASLFAMVPWPNRIANGRFAWRGRTVVLPVNHRAASADHPIHGLGWQAAWSVVERSATAAILRYAYRGGAWPWPFAATQTLTVEPGGYEHMLALTNLSDEAMPAGLGLHPYFPRDGATMTRAFPTRSRMGADELPLAPQAWNAPPPMRPQDDCYASAREPIVLTWPDCRVVIEPDAAFGHTHVYVPEGEPFFCVEPVSHPPDAANRGGLRALDPGETWTTRTRFRVEAA